MASRVHAGPSSDPVVMGNMPRARLLAGLAIVVGIGVSWTATTQFAQAAQSRGPHPLQAPFFIVYLHTLFKTLLALPLAVRAAHMRSWAPFLDKPAPVPLPRIAARAAALCVVATLTNCAYVRALEHASASIVTALFSTAPMFVLALSTLLLAARPRLLAALAAACSVTGVLCVTQPWRALQSTGAAQPAGAWQGTVLPLCAAMGAALYKVSFKRWFPSPTPMQVSLLLACIGAGFALVGAALLPALWAAGAEPMPTSSAPWGALLGGSALGLVFDFLVNYGVALTHPVFVSIGTMVGIPLNLAVDALLHGTRPSALAAGGMLLICAGFAMVVGSEWASGVDATGARGKQAVRGDSLQTSASAAEEQPDGTTTLLASRAPAEPDTVAPAARAALPVVIAGGYERVQDEAASPMRLSEEEVEGAADEAGRAI